MKKIIAGFLIVLGLGLAGYSVYGGGTLQAPVVTAEARDAAEAQPQLLAQADLSPAGLHPALQVQPTDRVLGDNNAPVTIIEYVSMTCPHCADFHTAIFAQLKKDYIDTGKVKFIMRDLPWDNMALGIAKVARCADPNQFYMLTGAFLKTQKNWLRSADPLAEIKKIARLAGMDDVKVEQCLKDADLHEEVLASKRIAREVLNVRGTPTLFVNGELLNGVPAYNQLRDVIETALERTRQDA
jgi:protein-disulfide isomerase